MNEATSIVPAETYQGPKVVLPTYSPYTTAIERAAADPDFDINKFQQLLELQERHDLRMAKRAFNAAIAQARAEIKPILKNRTVTYTTQKGTTSYEHEDLAQIATQVDPILAKYGLSYRWRTKSVPNEPIQVTCIVSHELGHSEENTLDGPRDDSGQKNAIQQIGSSLTYLQRYTLKAALGLAAAKDTDGLVVESSGKINDVQAKEIYDLIEKNGRNEALFLKHYKIDKVEDLPAVKFKAAQTALSTPKPNVESVPSSDVAEQDAPAKAATKVKTKGAAA